MREIPHSVERNRSILESDGTAARCCRAVVAERKIEVASLRPTRARFEAVAAQRARVRSQTAGVSPWRRMAARAAAKSGGPSTLMMAAMSRK